VGEYPQISQAMTWWPGGSQGANIPAIFVGDQLLVAVLVREMHSVKARWCWEFSVIKPTESGGWECNEEPWGWEWHNVEWWAPINGKNLPMPKGFK
jgi:hypothetical protein